MDSTGGKGKKERERRGREELRKENRI